MTLVTILLLPMQQLCAHCCNKATMVPTNVAKSNNGSYQYCLIGTVVVQQWLLRQLWQWDNGFSVHSLLQDTTLGTTLLLQSHIVSSIMVRKIYHCWCLSTNVAVQHGLISLSTELSHFATLGSKSWATWGGKYPENKYTGGHVGWLLDRLILLDKDW
jgi:hypothetical protein